MMGIWTECSGVPLWCGPSPGLSSTTERCIAIGISFPIAGHHFTKTTGHLRLPCCTNKLQHNKRHPQLSSAGSLWGYPGCFFQNYTAELVLDCQSDMDTSYRRCYSETNCTRVIERRPVCKGKPIIRTFCSLCLMSCSSQPFWGMLMMRARE